MTLRRRLCRRSAARISRARGAANIHARTGLTSFYSRLIQARQGMEVRDEFLSVCERAGFDSEDAYRVWNLIRYQYDSLRRSYHNLGHIADCLALLDVVPVQLSDDDKDVATYAFVLHDACCDSWARDNEERSAVLSDFCLDLLDINIGSGFLRKASSLIMPATKHPLMVDDRLGQLVADIDLYGLSLPESEFLENTRKIRGEFFWKTDARFNNDMVGFFTAMLQRPSIYQTDWFRENFEKAARYNLKKAVAVLRPK